MANPLSNDEMLSLGRQYHRLADREGASDRDQAALRDFVPALLCRFGELTRDMVDVPVLDLRFCGVEVAQADDDQIELALPQPE